MNEYKCIVVGLNPNGEPDLAFVIVKTTAEKYENGVHLNIAHDWAEDRGYEPVIVLDENDPGGRMILDKFDWETADVVS